MLDFFLSGKRSVPIDKTKKNSERKNLQTVHTLTHSLDVFFNRAITQQSRTTPAHSDNENGNLSSIPICWFGNVFNRFFYFFNLLQLISEIFKWPIPNGKYVLLIFFVSDLIFLKGFVIC